MGPERWLVWADRAYFGMAIIAAVATALTVVAGIWQYRLNARISDGKDRQLAEYQSDAGLRIASANVQAEKARQLAAEAQAATAKATLATEELRKQTTGRTMPDDQIQEIASALRGTGVHLRIECPFGDAEAAVYAAQINIMLTAAGVDTGKVNLRYDGMFFGIALTGPDDTYTQILRRSFESRGAKVTYTPSSTYSLYIGNRLPPFVQP